MAATQPAPANPKIEKALEELVVQLRHQNRQSDMPEFSLARLAAVIVQILALLMLFVGLYRRFPRPPRSTNGTRPYWAFSAPWRGSSVP